LDGSFFFSFGVDASIFQPWCAKNERVAVLNFKRMKNLGFIFTVLFASQLTAQLTNTVPTSGPVGIGTASPVPGNQLTVNGDARILSSMTIDGTLFIDGQTVMNSIVRMPEILDYVGGFGNFEIMVIDSLGRVTRGPVYDIMATLMEAPPSPIDYCLGIDTRSPQWFSGLYKMFSPCPEVKVGIGTSNPAFSLDVKGEIFGLKLLVGNELANDTALINAFAFNHTQRLFQLGKKVGGLAEEIRFIVNNDGSVELTNVGGNAAITINNGTGHAIVVKDNSGNKIAQLDGDGLFKARSIRVDLNTWADHVFDQNYKLMSLKEIKQFITENGHLPDVPKASEIESKGLDLGEMQRIQMQKIEELTLHLIQLDERLQTSETRIKALENENKMLKATQK